MWYLLGTVFCLTMLLLARRRLRRLRAVRRQYHEEIRQRINLWFDQCDDEKHPVVDIPGTSPRRLTDLAEEDLKTGTDSH